MKKVLLVLALVAAFGTANAQKITGKTGYQIDVTDYDEVTVSFSSNLLKGVTVSGDGYDDVVVNKNSEIIDNNKTHVGKNLTKFSKNPKFWVAFMKRNGFTMSDTDVKKNRPKSNIDAFVPGSKSVDTKLTFTKN